MLYTRLTQSSLKSYEQLALVAHAEGRLIAQLALVNHEDLAARVTHVFFFAPLNGGLRHPAIPLIRFVFDHLGWLWPFGFLAEPILGLLKKTLFQPLFDLLRDSPFLCTLNDRWKETFGEGDRFNTGPSLPLKTSSFPSNRSRCSGRRNA